MARYQSSQRPHRSTLPRRAFLPCVWDELFHLTTLLPPNTRIKTWAIPTFTKNRGFRGDHENLHLVNLARDGVLKRFPQKLQ